MKAEGRTLTQGKGNGKQRITERRDSISKKRRDWAAGMINRRRESRYNMNTRESNTGDTAKVKTETKRKLKRVSRKWKAKMRVKKQRKGRGHNRDTEEGQENEINKKKEKETR